MRKIIVAFDGSEFSQGAMDFARQMNERQAIFLTGVFIPQVIYAHLWSYADSASGSLFIPLLEGEESDAVNKNIAHFEKECNRYNIKYKVHKDFLDFALPELKKETRFADLVILGSESFYSNLGTEKPNEYLKEALRASECPVIVVPEKFEFPKSNVLACDGSEASVFAIKQFAYLFPEFSGNNTLLVTVQPATSPVKDNFLNVKELVQVHFPNLSVMNLDMDPRKYFAAWISEKKSAILVSGSFSRSFLSQLFKQSFVADVIRDHKVPVFVAHR